MKKALICPNEVSGNGCRVADVVDSEFEVAPPLFWVDCEDHINGIEFWYDDKSKAFVAFDS